MYPTCANCGIEIRWLPTVVDGKTYCCLGCSQGGPCECDYSALPQEGDRVAIVMKKRHEATENHGTGNQGSAR